MSDNKAIVLCFITIAMCILLTTLIGAGLDKKPTFSEQATKACSPFPVAYLNEKTEYYACALSATKADDH